MVSKIPVGKRINLERPLKLKFVVPADNSIWDTNSTEGSEGSFLYSKRYSIGFFFLSIGQQFHINRFQLHESKIYLHLPLSSQFFPLQNMISFCAYKYVYTYMIKLQLYF